MNEKTRLSMLVWGYKSGFSCMLGMAYYAKLDTDEYWQLHRNSHVVGGIKADPNGIYHKPLVKGIKVKLDGNSFKLKVKGFKTISIDHMLRRDEQIVIETDRDLMIYLKLSDGRRVKEKFGVGKHVVKYKDLL